MDAPSFDRFVRTLAVGRDSRRGLFAHAIGGLAGGLALSGAHPVAAKDKGNGKGNGNDPACRGEGHPCEGNQVCCEGLVCTQSGPGAANRCAAPSAGGCTDCAAVAAVAAYAVAVNCSYDEGVDETTCTCTAQEPAGAPAVRALAVSTAEVCAEVVGGDATLASPGPPAAGFASNGGGGTLTLVLSGKVEAQGSTTWWCTTDAGTVPATGPGLVRVQTAVSDSTGAVEVHTLACAEAAPASGFDWYGKCTAPKSGARFTLGVANDAGAAPKQAVAGPDGRCVFGGLQPGTYRLTQTGATWCHAESDAVDQQGNVVVKAGQRVTVWIFDCAAAK